MITHVVFDFDGTLVDSHQQLLELYNAVAAEDGFGCITPDNLNELLALSIPERARLLGVPLHRLPGLISRVAREYRGVTGQVACQPGVPELLRALRAAGREVLVLSTNDEGNIRAVLRRHALESLVSGVYCSNRVFGKARLLRRLMRREQVRPEQLVYVGDEQRDVLACREAGVRVIAVTWGIDTPEVLRAAGPDHRARRPADILGVLGLGHAVQGA